MQDICNFAETGLGSSLLLLTGAASLATIMVITISYMIGKVFSNPKIHLWAKTEMLQIVISLASVGVLFLVLQSFCIIDVNSLYTLTDLPASQQLQANANIFDAAENFLKNDAVYTHTILEIERYHIMSYNMLMMRGRYDCVFGPLLCLFGNAGTSNSPYAWSSLTMGAMNVAFNATLISYMTTLVSLFILLYTKTGFVLFLLPLGIFFRSMPYLRSLGSLFITVAFCFVIVYPTILAIFNLIDPFLFSHTQGAFIDPQMISGNVPAVLFYSNPDAVVEVGSGLSSFAASWDWGEPYDEDDYIDFFFPIGRKEPIVYQLAGRSFITGTFIPLVALLATVASISHIGRLLGEEIDLSRIVRMV